MQYANSNKTVTTRVRVRRPAEELRAESRRQFDVDLPQMGREDRVRQPPRREELRHQHRLLQLQAGRGVVHSRTRTPPGGNR